MSSINVWEKMSWLYNASRANVFRNRHEIVSLVFGSVMVNFTPGVEDAAKAKKKKKKSE